MLGWALEERVFQAPYFFGETAPVNCVPCPSTLIGREALLELGGFDTRVPYSGPGHRCGRRLREAGLLAACWESLDELRPGRVARRGHGSQAVAEAEGMGVPALLHDPADPLSDMARAAFV